MVLIILSWLLSLSYQSVSSYQITLVGDQLVLSLTEQNFSFQVLLAYFLIRFIWSMISYGSGLPQEDFSSLLVLGSLLGAF